MKSIILVFVYFGALAYAQEASSGFDLQSTVSGTAAYSHGLSAEPRDGPPFTGGMRAMFYPTWKVSKNWSVTGAIQVASRRSLCIRRFVKIAHSYFGRVNYLLRSAHSCFAMTTR